MDILLVNPNTSKSMTEQITMSAQSVISPKTNLISTYSKEGPPSIEGFYDEAFCLPGLLAEVRKYSKKKCEGVVIACFDDTGVDAARSIIDQPVIGICQASMQTASILSNSFSIITSLERSIPAIENLVIKYGMERFCKSIIASNIPVLDLDKNESYAKSIISKIIENILKDNLSESIILGGAGMSNLATQLTNEFKIPIIDGVTSAIKIIEGIIVMNLKTSKRIGYSKPLKKEYTGRFNRDKP